MMKDKTNRKKEKKAKKERYGMRRLLSNVLFAWKQVYRAFPPIIVIAPMLEILVSIAFFFNNSYFLYKAVDMMEKGTDVITIIWFTVIAFTLSFVLTRAYNLFYSIRMRKIWVKIAVTFNKKLLGKAAELDLSCYETPSVYDKMARAFDLGAYCVTGTFDNVNDLLWRITELCMTSFLVLLIDPVLFAFAAVPFLLGLLKNFKNNLKNDRDNEFKKSWRRADYVRRIFYQTEYAKELRLGKMSFLMVNHLRAAYVSFKKTVRQYGWRLALIECVETIGYQVVTVFGAMAYSVWRVSEGHMSVASCIVVINSIGVVASFLSGLVVAFGKVGKSAREVGDLRLFLDMQPTIAENPDLPGAVSGDITLNHVSFRYDGAEEDTLKDINLTLHKGERIALVGQNGAGKTTLVKLLLRLYDPTSGTVSVNGTEAKDYRLSSWRNMFGCVYQDCKVLAATVRENVLMGEPIIGGNEDEIVTEALKKSGAWEKVSSFEKGIDTMLTREFDDKGENLSGGEAQKVVLARIFARKRPFVILDEPSSALDPVAEHKMFENMMAAVDGATVLFISHRLSSAVNADRILMMENGSIVEMGTHTQLMAQNGKYAAMFSVQAANYNGQTIDVEEVAAQ